VTYAIVALVGVAMSAAWAEPAHYRIDAAHTHADFTVAQLGLLEAHGRFDNVSGRIVFDGAGHAGSIDLDIPVSSLATGIDMRDDFVRGVTMFDAERFPHMKFRSSRLDFDGDRLVRVDGNLTLRDVTRPVTFTVLRMDCAQGNGHGERCSADAEGAIRRREFAMDNWWPLIGDEVALRLRLVAVRE
jgi:polyisoprenoid-binding protein YceI